MKKNEAHEAIKPHKQTIRQRILQICEGKSLFEIAKELNVKPQTVSGRLSELEKDGIIYKATANVLHSIYSITPESEIQERKDRYAIERVEAMIKTLRTEYAYYSQPYLKNTFYKKTKID